MSLRDKLLKKAVAFLEEWGFQDFQVQWDTPQPKFPFPSPPPLGDKKVVPDLVCRHESGVTLVLEVVPTKEYMMSGEAELLWKALEQYVRSQPNWHLFFLTYKKFGDLEGRLMLRQRLREIFAGRSTRHIEILTHHRGKIQGGLQTLLEIEEEMHET